jgi:scyllo-inositol 2-dehydrogenase (NADP+)
VIVATPNATHADVAADALRAGSAVVVDKPVATTASSARQLIELAEQLGRSLTVYQNRRWDGDYLTASRLVRDGALGDVHTFESRFEPWKTANRAGWKSEATAAEGGGILFDLGPHLVDQALHLFGPVVDVHAEIARRRPSGAADDDVFVSLRHEGGVRSRLWMSHVAAQPGPRLRVLGTAGAYVVDGLDPQEAQLASGTSPRDPGYGRVPDERHGLVGIGTEARTEPTDRGRYPLFYEQLARALRGAGPLPVDPRDALAALEVIEAARESAGAA